MGYSERYVAFVDILGFSEIVKKTDREENLARYDALLKILSEIGSRENNVEGLPGADLQFQSFSDSIVISCNRTMTGLLNLLASINDLALKLLASGLLMRGGIATGRLHHDHVVMFGPAFLDAYFIETMIAKYPRVILRRETYDDFSKVKSALLFPEVRLADDGPPYLHIFSQFVRLNEAPQTPETLGSDDMFAATTCQKVIQSLLNDSIHNPNHYEKLRWLAIYWNGTVAREGGQLSMINFPQSQM